MFHYVSATLAGQQISKIGLFLDFLRALTGWYHCLSNMSTMLSLKQVEIIKNSEKEQWVIKWLWPVLKYISQFACWNYRNIQKLIMITGIYPWFEPDTWYMQAELLLLVSVECHNTQVQSRINCNCKLNYVLCNLMTLKYLSNTRMIICEEMGGEFE
jgi:hypothetical protein